MRKFAFRNVNTLGVRIEMSKCWWIPLSCAVGAFVIYLVTLSPSVDFIDSGELSTVVATLGVAHPTGYPLYTILGHLFVTLPLHSIAWRTNLFSALWSASSVGLVAWIVLGLLNVGKRLMNQTHIVVASLISAGYFAFSAVHWEQAVTTEVYPMTVCLVALLLGGLVRWFPRGDAGSNRPWLFLWCYLWGLGFGNHLMIVFLAPVTLVAALCYRKAFQNPWHTLLIGACFFLSGITICLYLPIRSSLNPIMNWGDPHTTERLWNHLTAKQYRIWMFSQGLYPLVSKFAASVGNLWHWLSPPGVLLAVVGFVTSWFDRPKANGVLLTLFLSDLIYSLNYDIPDIDSYYLPSHLVTAIWAGLGGYSILQTIASRGKTALSLASIILIATLAFPLIQHWKAANHRGDLLAESMGRGALASVPQGGLVLNGFWDLQSIGIYLQQIEGYRNDVTMIDALLMERSWYVHQQMRLRPEVFQGLESETQVFLNAVADFEAGRPYDSGRIEDCFTKLMNGIIEKNLKSRRVFVGFLEMGNHPNLGKGFDKIPREVYLEIDRNNPSDNEPPQALDMEHIARPEWVRTARTQWFLNQLIRQNVSRAHYWEDHGDYHLALQAVNRALRLAPDDLRILQFREYLDEKKSQLDY